MILKASPTAIEKAAKILQSGELVAFPTETVYGLGADATNNEAVKKPDFRVHHFRSGRFANQVECMGRAYPKCAAISRSFARVRSFGARQPPYGTVCCPSFLLS